MSYRCSFWHLLLVKHQRTFETLQNILKSNKRTTDRNSDDEFVLVSSYLSELNTRENYRFGQGFKNELHRYLLWMTYKQGALKYKVESN